MQHPLYRTLDSSSYPHSSLSFLIQGPSSHINTELTNDQLPVHSTYPTFYRTATTLLHMSLSAESLSLQCKHTATEQATDNGDPLLSNKKARQAAKDAKMGSSTLTATAKTSATEGPPAKKAAPMVHTLPSCLHPTTLTFPQPTAALHGQTSTRIKIVDDDDDIPRNVPPSKSCRILKLSHGSNGDDDEDLPALMETSNNENDKAEEVEEMAEAELGKSLLLHLSLLVSDPNTHAERLIKEWNSPIYVFFKHTPSIETIKGRRVHIFECNAKSCMGKGNGRMVRRYLDTGDVKSTGNLQKHARGCWGEEAVTAANNTKNVWAAREALGKAKLVDGSIMAAFERVAKDRVTYSHCQHTSSEAWYVD